MKFSFIRFLSPIVLAIFSLTYLPYFFISQKKLNNQVSQRLLKIKTDDKIQLNHEYCHVLSVDRGLLSVVSLSNRYKIVFRNKSAWLARLDEENDWTWIPRKRWDVVLKDGLQISVSA